MRRVSGLLVSLAALSACGSQSGTVSNPAQDRTPEVEPGQEAGPDAKPPLKRGAIRSATIWTGKIGDLSVTVCFNEPETGRRPGTGVYYYASQLRPIRLVPADPERFAAGDPAQELTEEIGYHEKGTGSWFIETVSDSAITGRWADGAKSLPVRLQPQKVELDAYASPCEANAFVEPMLVGGGVAQERARLGEVAYTKVTYTAPSHFEPDDYTVTTLALDPKQPGDATVNRALAKALPDGTAEHFMGQCVGMSVWRGNVGYSNETVSPILISKNWLGVEKAGSSYCGGAHPAHFVGLAVYNRQSGKEADPSTWFKPEALRFYEFESDTSQETVRSIAGLSPALLEKVIANWPGKADAINKEDRDRDEMCTDSARSDYGWNIGLRREGAVFVQQFPHVIFSCTVDVTVPWSDLTPFLSQEGERVRDSL